MKLKLNIFASMALMMAGLMITGCNDYLQRDPTQESSNETFWKSEADAKQALVGCYRFSSGWDNDNFDSAQGLLYLDFAGGDGTEKENFTTNMASVNTTATNSNIGRYWTRAYEHIFAHNNFLLHIKDCPMDEQKKESWAAEIRTLRCYYYFNLAFYFQNVPMPLEPMSVDEANTIEQTPQQDVYDFVESELKDAINVLPESYSAADYGRVTKGFAQGLLGRLYLAEGRYADAATVYKSIIDSHVYELDRTHGLDSYEKLFQIGGEYSKENIMVAMYVKDKYTNVHTIYKSPECVGGWHQFAVYNELVKEYFCSDGKSIEESPLYDENDPYKNRDIRLYASIFLPPLGTYPGTTYKGKTYDCYAGPNTADSYNRFTLFDGYCPKKGLDESVENLFNSYIYTNLMRYAEILLSYVEALNESNPSAVTQDVLDLTINDVRDRVGLPGLKAGMSQEELRQAIRKERRVELAFEGLHYFDVLRWGTAKQELNHYFTGVKLSDNPADRNYRGEGATASPVDKDGYYQFENRSWDDHNRYWPIPQKDMNVNHNLKQNPGYN